MLSPTRRRIALALTALLPAFTNANVEKTVFTAPASVPIPQSHPNLSDLDLHTLNPLNDTSLRTELARVFPSEPGNAALGQSSWFLLEGLQEGRRYELRVCWAATEPTSFDLDVYELKTVFETPELIQSLAAYTTARAEEDQRRPKTQSSPTPNSGERQASVLLAQVRAAADYYTDDEALMKNPPPVLVDLILDDYIFNLAPRSLMRTGLWIMIVAVIAWYMASPIASILQSIANGTTQDKGKKDI